MSSKITFREAFERELAEAFAVDYSDIFIKMHLTPEHQKALNGPWFPTHIIRCFFNGGELDLMVALLKDEFNNMYAFDLNSWKKYLSPVAKISPDATVIKGFNFKAKELKLIELTELDKCSVCDKGRVLKILRKSAYLNIGDKEVEYSVVKECSHCGQKFGVAVAER